MVSRHTETRPVRVPGYLPLALLVWVVGSLPWSALPTDAGELKDSRVFRESRFRSVAADRFMDLLAIKPGMTILDIGTGTGQFALGFAERLKGTGRVFATDIDNSCIDLVKKEAARRGLANLYPVLVTPKGVDEFYGRHRYDLITIMHVPIPNKTNFLATMRGYLAENGRVVFVLYKNAAPFSRQDFAGHFPELLKELSSEPADSPFWKGLGESTRQSIRKRPEAEPDAALHDAVVDDFNRMLSDTRFGLNFIDGAVMKDTVAFTPTEKAFADFLRVFLTEEGVFRKDRKDANPKQIRVAERFNKLLFLQRFRKCLREDRMFVSGPIRETRVEFERAGYQLAAERRDIMPFEDVLIFTAGRKGRGTTGE